MKTAMEEHLEWLKVRIVITDEMEKLLLEKEKQQIVNAYDTAAFNAFSNSAKPFPMGEQHYNQIFNK